MKRSAKFGSGISSAQVGQSLEAEGECAMVTGFAPDGSRRIGPYQLVRELGGGGMGRVFLGISAGGRPVAVKVIRPELAGDPEFRVRFGREVAAARKVSGMFTAPVVDADTDGPVPWLATAYVPGPSLAQHVAKHGPLPAEAVLALAAGLAESLAAIHAAGIVHRDLKPSNVLLAPDGPRVIDFGVSRAAEATTLTHTGLIVGSPGFMSPEQARGDKVGPSSDVFSLGAVLVFAATGRGPFGEGATPALVYRVVHETPVLDGVPDAIRPLAEQCLAKDPELRPSAGDLLLQTRSVQPGPGWLPQDVFAAFNDPGTLTATPPAAGPAKTAPPVGVTGRGRLASRRSLVIVGVVAALLAASVTIALAAGVGSATDRQQPTAAAAGVGGSPTAQSAPASGSASGSGVQSAAGTQTGAGTQTAGPGTSEPGGSVAANPTTSSAAPARSPQPSSPSTPPVTSAPVTSAPVTSAPVTSAPVTLAPAPGPSSPTPTPTPTDTVTKLGGVDLQAWCQSLGYVEVELVESDVDGWKCVTSTGTTVPISIVGTCRSQYNDPEAEAYYSDFSNPDSWYCTSS
jgi:serine/threonine protein kinase